MPFLKLLSILLQVFALMGTPLYINFYSNDSSAAFLSMSRIMFGVLCFLPLFMLAQIVVCLVKHSASLANKRILLPFQRMISWIGIVFYLWILVFCVTMNFIDLWHFGISAYRNFPISLSFSIYFSSILEIHMSVVKLRDCSCRPCD